MLGSLTDWASARGLGVQAALALGNVFQLTESCLGRTLVTRVADDEPLTSDEEGVLMLLALPGDVGPHCGTRTIPHGLPGALAWAVRSANRWCGGSAVRSLPAKGGCPFGGETW